MCQPLKRCIATMCHLLKKPWSCQVSSTCSTNCSETWALLQKPTCFILKIFNRTLDFNLYSCFTLFQSSFMFHSISIFIHVHFYYNLISHCIQFPSFVLLQFLSLFLFQLLFVFKIIVLFTFLYNAFGIIVFTIFIFLNSFINTFLTLNIKFCIFKRCPKLQF